MTPDWLLAYMAIAGVCALLLGLRKTGMGLIMPAIMSWIIWPLLWPMVLPQIQRIPALLLLLAVPVVVVFGGLLMLDRILTWVYGKSVGGHVTAIYLVRVIDAIGRGLVFCVVWLFRLFAQLLRPR